MTAVTADRGTRTPNAALRAARTARSWTIARLIEELDSVNGRPTGLAISTVSAWETGRSTTSLPNQELVCRLFGATPAALGFAAASAQTEGLGLATSYENLLHAMTAVVDSASECLVITGSRSREQSYLERIEQVLFERPEVEHVRVLFGPPRHPFTRNHLLRLAEMREQERAAAIQIGIVTDLFQQPERFIVASERRAVLILPSPMQVDHFDSGLVVTDSALAAGWVRHVCHAYAGSQQLHTLAAVRELTVVR